MKTNKNIRSKAIPIKKPQEIPSSGVFHNNTLFRGYFITIPSSEGIS
jgi:hypothetical protein